MPHDYCDIILFRHGQTDWNAIGKVQGHSDIPLNEKGEAQARELRDRLKSVIFTHVYSSDLQRARTTAQIVAGLNYRVKETRMLRERAMGAWEGSIIPKFREVEEAIEPMKVHATKEEYLHCRFDNDAESYSEVYKRLQNFLVELVGNHVGETLLLSSHAGVLSALLYHLDYREGLHWSVANCGFIEARAFANGCIEVKDSSGVSLRPYFCLCQASKA